MRSDSTVKAYMISVEDHIKFYESNLNPPVNYDILAEA